MGLVLSSVDNQPEALVLPEFTHSSGPTPRTKEAKTPLQVFQLFFTTIILDSIVQQTVLFVSQKGTVLQFCEEELMAFIGVNITMVMLRLPDLHDYWSKNTVSSRVH